MARFPLQRLVEYAATQVDDAAKVLARCAGALEREKAKCEQLEGYKGEYLRRLGEAGRMGMNVLQLQDFQLFLGKLDTAIDGQKQEVERAERAWNQAREDWMHARRKLLGYETLATRFHKEQEVREARREQKETDEYARNSAMRRERSD